MDRTRRSLGYALVWCCVATFFLAALAGCQSKGSNYYPGTLQIPKAQNLSPEQEAVEKRFATAIENNLNVFVAAYRWYWPKTVNTDNARELSTDYAPDGVDSITKNTKDHRTEYSVATELPAKALAMEVYRRMLTEGATAPEKPMVVFTAGGAGSGKTTSIKALRKVGQVVDEAQIVYDTTLSNEQLSQEQIRMALDAGKSVKIVYVYRDPIQAFDGALKRAMAVGRTVTIKGFLNTHMGALTVMDNVKQSYSQEIENGRVEIYVIDNTLGPEAAREVSDGVSFLDAKDRTYTRSGLRQILENTLTSAYRSGTVTKEIYDAVNK